MPGATNTVQVDGVEPSIPVRLLDVDGNPERVKLFTAEDGTERFLVRGADEPLMVTPADLSVLGGVGIEIVGADEPDETEPDEKTETITAQNRPVVTIPPVNPPNTPGQTGQ